MGWRRRDRGDMGLAKGEPCVVHCRHRPMVRGGQTQLYPCSAPPSSQVKVPGLSLAHPRANHWRTGKRTNGAAHPLPGWTQRHPQGS